MTADQIKEANGSGRAPVYVDGEGRWWFRDETGDVWGPFITEDDARDALAEYCREVLGP